MTSNTVKTTSPADKKDVQKLQRAIIDGLEDVKAQNIQVFDTEHITSLFERVIVASGTSNRQTKALAASVRDSVRDAGFAKPRIEGESNGEWIIVDCGAAVAHIMQPTIRQYYNLEELWGDKPIKLKLGAPAPLVKASKPQIKAEITAPLKRKPGAKSAVKPGVKTALRVAKDPAKVLAHVADSSYVGRVGKTNDWTAKRNATTPAAEPIAKSARVSAKLGAKVTAKPASKKSETGPATKTPSVKLPASKRAPAKKVVAKATTKTTPKAASKTSAKVPTAKKIATRSK
ncbi:MAG: ribosome silencing factor [Polaromonas sp.]|uniref:ribosome silencing factor n=1 Tax=Polaromonas sp. TaxID=1869339 RepID=UPI00183872F3|nr:ribosome silencing factor [Polaromonas sp.]NMM09835.1 ribosome silencing factor [Polaromonas sp.]